MLVLLQTILGLHPAGALRATRFVPDESVTSMTVTNAQLCLERDLIDR